MRGGQEAPGSTKKKHRPNPLLDEHQATIYAAEQTLKPWEVRPSKPGAQGKPVSQRTRYKAALGAPVNAPIKVGRKTVPARELLADTMTPERKRQHRETYQPPVQAPKADTSFLHALLSTPAAVLHHDAAIGKAVAKGASAYAKDSAPLFGLAPVGGYGRGHYSPQQVEHAVRTQTGNALYNAVTEGQTSHLGAAGLEAATIFPGFRAFKLAREAAKAAKEGHAAEEAAKVVEEAAPPVLSPAEKGGKQIIAGMSQATRLRREQESLRHLERGVRSAAAARALETPGEEGRIAAMAALKGPMPTLKWGRFDHFDQQAVDAMVAHIRAHPSLEGLPYTKLNTENALLSVIGGNLPRKFEQKLLRNVFGDATDNLLKSVTFWQRAKGAGLNLVGVPRALEASFDLSAPLRQALLYGISHPVMWSKTFPTMLKAAKDPAFYEQVNKTIAEMPTFDLMQKGGVQFTDLGSELAGREEARMSSYAERIYGIGKVVRASNRGYTAFLNKARADYFNWLLEQTHTLRPDIDLEGPEAEKYLKDFARVVGNATGRGTVKNETISKALPAINQLLFAPRLLKARFDVIANPGYYWSLRDNPIARREAFKHLAGLVGTVGGVLTLAKLAGARVNQDPRNADWAKIRVGNTRFDIAAGFQQQIRLLAQVGTGTIVSSTTGKELHLGADSGYGHLTKADILQRFAETKLAPPPSIVYNFFRGSDFQGKPFSWKLEAYNRLTPLLAQDAIDLYRQGDNTAGNIAAATAIYGIGMWGIGTQTYGPKKPAAGGYGENFGSLTSGSSGSTNPLLSSSSGGSANPLLGGYP